MKKICLFLIIPFCGILFFSGCGKDEIKEDSGSEFPFTKEELLNYLYANDETISEFRGIFIDDAMKKLLSSEEFEDLVEFQFEKNSSSKINLRKEFHQAFKDKYSISFYDADEKTCEKFILEYFDSPIRKSELKTNMNCMYVDLGCPLWHIAGIECEEVQVNFTHREFIGCGGGECKPIEGMVCSRTTGMEDCDYGYLYKISQAQFDNPQNYVFSWFVNSYTYRNFWRYVANPWFYPTETSIDGGPTDTYGTANLGFKHNINVWWSFGNTDCPMDYFWAYTFFRVSPRAVPGSSSGS